MEKSNLLLLFTGIFLCLLQTKGVSSSCEDINRIDFAEITYVEPEGLAAEPEGLAAHPEGTIANVECDVFYQIVPIDFEETTCINGSWTGVLPQCRHVPRHCPRKDNFVEIYGRDCQDRCRNRLVGACRYNKQCHCDGVCGWSCIAIYEDNFCPEVNEQDGLLVTYDPPERRFNGYAEFSCSEGYIQHSGSTRLRCMSNRQWGGGDRLVCMPNVVCGDPPSVEHASLQQSSKHFFLPGETRSYSCNLGYTILGNREITCLENHEWSPVDFSCRPRSCNYPGRIPNADLLTRRYLFTDRAIYECREGYENPPYTPSFRTCQANGEWSHFIPVCQPIECPEILDLDNGRVNSWGNTFESAVTFECNEGYRLDGSARRVCQGDKTWSGQDTVCTEIICEDPGNPRNGYKTNERPVYRLNDVLYFHCNEGHTMDGSISNYCTESGEWAHPVPLCGENCIVPPRPRDGWLTSENQYRPGASVPHNTRLHVQCRSWRFTKRQNSLQCNNGVWSDSDDVRLCEGKQCGVRTSINLIVTYDPPVSEEDLLNNRIPHDTGVRYACGRGYSIVGREETRCMHGGYQYSVPRCEPVSCQEADVTHGRLQYFYPNGSAKHTTPAHGDTRKLRCGSGYKLRGSSRSHCDNGVWVNEGTDDIGCDPKPCDPIPETYGSFNYNTIAKPNGKYTHGTRVDVNCHSGYLPAVGDGTAFCKASQWWRTIPTCLISPNVVLDSQTSQTPHRKKKIKGDNSYLAKDGNTGSAPWFCSRTSIVFNPWWKAVMTKIYNVTDVKIYNRLDRTDHIFDLEGAEVRVGMNEDHTTNLLCGEPITRDQIQDSSEQNHGILIRCGSDGISGIIGNTISVHIPVNERRELSLCEIEVYEQGKPFSVNGTKEGTQVGCEVPHVDHASITSHGVAKQQVILAGDDVRFSCDSGYNLRGSNHRHVDLFCLTNSSWDKELPVCEPQTCTVNRLINGGFPERKITYDHGENITFYCNPGFQKEYNRYWCERTTALPSNPACVGASCNAPNLPSYMIPTQSLYAHGDLLNFSCERGFQLNANQGNSLPECWLGEWRGSLNVTCQRVQCPPPGRSSFSSIETLSGVQGYVHGARIGYTCIEGYEIQGIAERECDNGQWTGSEPVCRVAAPPRCMLPERSNGERYSIIGYFGNIFDEGLPIGEQVDISVRCNPGYLAQSAVRTTCLENGVWSVIVPICERIERLCSKPDYISRVVQYVNGLETNELNSYPHNELPEGTFLLSHCSLPGEYTLQGSANRTCSEGSWTGDEPSCVPAATRITFYNDQPLQVRSNGTIVIYPRSRLDIYCRMPYGVHKTARLTSDNGPYAYYGNVHTYMVMTLNPPNALHSGRFTCRSYDGTLSHSVFVEFAEVNCRWPGVPTNGQLHDHAWNRGTYNMGKEVTYTCNRGYSLEGERRITCVLGQWSNPVPRCRRATCPELQPPNHGTKMGSNRIGDSVLIGCNHGYQLQGEAFLDCLETGEWSHPLPSCLEIVRPERPCDLVNCEVWQKCVIGPSNVGICGCISPHDCPETEESEPEVCGTDGRNYTSICRLKALACILHTGVEEASSNWFCIQGVPEVTQSPQTPPVNHFGDQSSSSSFDVLDLATTPDAPSIPDPTLPANEGPVETDAPVPRQPATVDPRSYTFCEADVCPTSSTAEFCRDAAAVVIAFADYWDADRGIMGLEIYEVMSGELPSWTAESYQEVRIDVDAASERGCLCPSFPSSAPVIIRFSQNLTLDGRGLLLHSDVVLPYSQKLYEEIRSLLQEPPEPVHTPAPQGSIQLDGGTSSFSFSFSSYNGGEEQPQSSSYPDSDVIITTSTIHTEGIDEPRSSDSSWEEAV